MWTHRKPYTQSRLTRESIRYHGEVGLYRALNIGNLIGFIGSGVTVAYGRPSWHELVDMAYIYVDKHFNGEPPEGGNDRPPTGHAFFKAIRLNADNVDKDDAVFGLGELWRALERFHVENRKRPQPDGEKLKIALEMCENLSRAMDLYAARIGKRRYYAAGLRHALCEKISGTAPLSTEDPLAEIYQRLGISRFLTVNYDIEIERFLYDRAGFGTPPLDGNGFTKLPSMRAPQPPDDKFNPIWEKNSSSRIDSLFSEHPTHLTSTDNLGRSVQTVRLVESSLGDLLTFATCRRPHEAQVFHLHGRLDDPRSLMLTEGDYQRVYVNSGLIHRTFEETLNTLFLGNDVLFIGLGMNEADLLRPLRQFVVTDRLADVEARRIFALLPFSGESEAIAQSLDLKVRYGVQTLFFGEGRNWQMRRMLNPILDWLRKQRGKTFRDDRQGRKDWRAAFLDLRSSLNDLDQSPLEKNDSESLEELEDTEGQKQHREIFATLPADDSPATRDAAFQALRNEEDRWRLETQVKTALRDLQTEALCDKIRWLAVERQKWWEDWLTEPHPRCMPYAYLGDQPVCFRHRPAYRTIAQSESAYGYQAEPGDKNEKRSFLTEHVLKLMPPLTEPMTQRRILHLTNDRGSGKGAFLHELQAGNYTALIEEKYLSEYEGAFFANTTFSPEFSSIVAALVRFVARHVANEEDLKRARQYLSEMRTRLGHAAAGAMPSPDAAKTVDFFENYPHLLFETARGSKTTLWPDNETPNTLSQLRRVLERLKATKAPRLFICLSGLERLCDRTGNAYSSAHRAFFRLLIDPDFKELPVDLVLISGDPAHPIRYLGEKKEWHRLPRLPLGERHWLQDAAGRYITAKDLEAAPILAKQMMESVALDSWISLCASHCFDDSGILKAKDKSNGLRKNQWIALLENAAGRNRQFEVLTELFETYRKTDKLEPQQQDTNLPSPSDIRELVLHHLAFFSLPIQPSALVICPDIRRSLARLQEGTNKNDIADYSEKKALEVLLEHLKVLHERGLVIRVYPGRTRTKTNDPDQTAQSQTNADAPEQTRAQTKADDPEQSQHMRYALHGQMRQYLAHQMRFALPDRGERNYYGVSLYTVQPRDLPTPSEVHFRRVSRIVEELLYAARSTLRPFYEQIKTRRNSPPVQEDELPNASEIHQMTYRLRAAYSILRESFSIGSLSRLTRFEGSRSDPGEPYEVYRSLLGALIGAAVGIHCWNDEERAKRLTGAENPPVLLKHRLKDSAFDLHHPFYRQEILWLINERGLTAFVQGRLYDSVPLFNQALRIARKVTEGGHEDDSFRATERRVLLNLAVAEIERGHIHVARRILEGLHQRKPRSDNSTPSVTKALAGGYLGLCDHLSGHLKRAEKRYRKVLKDAESIESMRSLAIFHRHYADLLRLLNRTDEAQEHLRLAMLAAARDEQKDVYQHALIAHARLHRDIGNREMVREASRQLDEAERYARELGLIKLEVEALKVRSTIILAQGETEQAGRLAARAVGLANRHGMELHKINALVIHGRILLERGHTDLARSVLKSCVNEAERRSYQLAAISAGRLLRNSVQPPDADELGTIWVKGGTQ